MSPQAHAAISGSFNGDSASLAPRHHGDCESATVPIHDVCSELRERFPHNFLRMTFFARKKSVHARCAELGRRRFRGSDVYLFDRIRRLATVFFGHRWFRRRLE